MQLFLHKYPAPLSNLATFKTGAGYIADEWLFIRAFKSYPNEYLGGINLNFEALGFLQPKGLRGIENSRFFNQKSFLTSYSGPSDGI